ncbi:MAG: protoporphyrinogen oxidase [Chloroflexi bacterium]|nr:MAG: protoporphyrinogen oxidase [Chloroflexota bacterium]
METAESQQIVIIGGGISGLSAAYYLLRSAEAGGFPLRVLVIEREQRLGGKICTDVVGEQHPFLLEGGPDAFLAQKPAATDLATDLGLAQQLIGTSPAQPATSILVHGRPRALPEGLRLITPTRLRPFLVSPVISPAGKVRMLLDLVNPARRIPTDESLAAFVRARFGTEALDRLAEPLLAGIYSADPEKQSMLATFPQLRALEDQYGSVIRGTRASSAAAPDAAGSQSRTSPFLTLQGGMGRLVQALADRLHGHIQTGRRVLRIVPSSRPLSHYQVELDDGTAVEAHSVIVAAPAFVAAELIESWQPELSSKLRGIPYVSTGTISLGYRRADIHRPFAGFGLVIPRRERRSLNAVTVCSDKFAGRAPSGQVLLRVFFGGFRNQHLVDASDGSLLDLARRDLYDLMGIEVPPVFTRIYRWRQASPQYHVGHQDLVAEIARLSPPYLWLSGPAYYGVGIPDCVRQAKAAAEQVVDQVLHHLDVSPAL